MGVKTANYSQDGWVNNQAQVSSNYFKGHINVNNLANLYDNGFYAEQIDGSYRSAKKFVDILSNVFVPSSVVDLGCGRGTWLKAFIEQGASKAVGLDGAWNSQEQMIDPAIKFIQVDLNKSLDGFDLPKFDLAMSLEVAEHLEASSAKTFVESLTNLSDNVLFGAAYTGQGGTNHINEQPHSYWADFFKQYDYAPFDIFRPRVWGDDEIDFWYRQNSFLYLRSNSDLHNKLTEQGYRPVDIEFMNCIHPRLYEHYTGPETFISLLKKMIILSIPQSMRPAISKVKKVIMG